MSPSSVVYERSRKAYVSSFIIPARRLVLPSGLSHSARVSLIAGFKRQQEARILRRSFSLSRFCSLPLAFARARSALLSRQGTLLWRTTRHAGDDPADGETPAAPVTIVVKKQQQQQQQENQQQQQQQQQENQQQQQQQENQQQQQQENQQQQQQENQQQQHQENKQQQKQEENQQQQQLHHDEQQQQQQQPQAECSKDREKAPEQQAETPGEGEMHIDGDAEETHQHPHAQGLQEQQQQQQDSPRQQQQEMQQQSEQPQHGEQQQQQQEQEQKASDQDKGQKTAKCLFNVQMSPNPRNIMGLEEGGRNDRGVRTPWVCRDCAQCLYCCEPIDLPLTNDRSPAAVAAAAAASRAAPGTVAVHTPQESAFQSVVNCYCCNSYAHGACCYPSVRTPDRSWLVAAAAAAAAVAGCTADMGIGYPSFGPCLSVCPPVSLYFLSLFLSLFLPPVSTSFCLCFSIISRLPLFTDPLPIAAIHVVGARVAATSICIGRNMRTGTPNPFFSVPSKLK